MATNYYNEKYAIETDFLNTADALLAEAKEVWDNPESKGLKREDRDGALRDLRRRLEAAKDKAIQLEAAMFESMSADLDKAHAKPLTEGQAANLQAATIVGISRDNAASVYEAVRGNATGVSTLCDLAARNDLGDYAMFDLPAKPAPLHDLKKGLERVKENRKERIERYGGFGDIHTSGPDSDFFMPDGKDKRMTAAQDFLDEYGY